MIKCEQTSLPFKIKRVHRPIASVVVLNVLFASVQQFVHERGLAVVNVRDDGAIPYIVDLCTKQMLSPTRHTRDEFPDFR